MTTLPSPKAPSDVRTGAIPAAHVRVDGGVLSTHGTASGTTTYVRCSCGGFFLLVADRAGGWRQVAHAAAAGSGQDT